MKSALVLIIALVCAVIAISCTTPADSAGNLSCVTSTEVWGVRGESLRGILEDGDTVTIRFGYYRCNEVQRGDIVVYNWSARDVPLIKIVKAIPGDSISLQENGTGYLIVVNEEPVTTTDGQPYLIGGRKYTMLSLYVNDYKNGIPKDTYLLLGNDPAGTLDSTRFGMVDRQDILGKAEPAAKR